MRSTDHKPLTGVWHGLYSYPRYFEPVYFVATLLASGAHISGTTHEALTGRKGAPLTAFASIDGFRTGRAVSFLKQYDGSGGMTHAVNYAGELAAGDDEIEGVWSLPAGWSGRFLMIRNSGASESVVRGVYEEVR